MVIRHLKDLRDKTNLPVEQAAQLISAKHPKGMTQVTAFDAIAPKADIDTIINAINERHDKRYSHLEAKIDALMDLNKALLERLDEREQSVQQLTEIMMAQKAIAAAGEREEREKERDAKITQVLREIQEAKVAANKSVWSRLFGK